MKLPAWRESDKRPPLREGDAMTDRECLRLILARLSEIELRLAAIEARADVNNTNSALTRLKNVYHKLEVVEGLFEFALSSTMDETNFFKLGENMRNLQIVTRQMHDILKEIFPASIDPPVVDEFKRKWKESES